MKRKLVRIVLFAMIISSVLSVAAYADSVQPRYSDYIDSYRTYVYSTENGVAQVWFEIKANRTSNQVGVQTIYLQMSDDNENWTNVQTFNSTDYSSMIAYDTICNVSYVQTSVDPGHYYRAGVIVYVENGGSDSRFVVTSSKYI